MATSEQIFEDLLVCHAERDPAFIKGPPGIGKSDLVGGLAKHLDINLIDFRTALRDPTDIKGFPMPDAKNSVMKYLRDSELPRNGKGILFFDEMTSGSQAVQAACMQLCLPPYAIGDYKLPEGWWIVGGGNREGDRGVTHRMPAPLANRFTHFEMECEPSAWVNWALNNSVAAEDIAFIRFRQDLLFTFDPKSADQAFGTPRSWVKAFRQAKKAKNEASAYRLVAGTVGNGGATEYFAFLNTIKELPSLDDIKLHPDTTPVPEKPAVMHAVTTMLAMNTTTDAGFARFMAYVSRMQKEFQVVYVKDSMKKVESIKRTKDFTKWVMDNESVLT